MKKKFTADQLKKILIKTIVVYALLAGEWRIGWRIPILHSHVPQGRHLINRRL
jgi:hypothetical protein